MATKIVGRILLSSLFIVSALRALLFNLDGFSNIIASKNLNLKLDPKIVAITVLIFKLVIGIALALGIRTKDTSILLIIFTAIATIFYHNAFVDSSQFSHMLKNIAIIGGLLLIQ
jgi:putative oxidoreductase